MKQELELKLDKIRSFVSDQELAGLAGRVRQAHQTLHDHSGAGSDYLGWLELPKDYDRQEFQTILAAAHQIRETANAFVVIGIGGSYLGARAGIELLNHSFYNQLTAAQRHGPRLYYLGQTLSPTYTSELLELLTEQDLAVNVISKSGTTTEPALAFRLLRELIIKKYGRAGARQRIFVTTDRTKSPLQELAQTEGYQQFVIPEDIGGRYSVLTPVGLLPLAVSGLDIQAIMDGAAAACQQYLAAELQQNPAYQYAAVRQLLYQKGKLIEVLVNYEPSLHYFGEWWKQLFAESEGKAGQGIFPAVVDFSTDLHSLGQYLQEGARHLFETVLWVERSRRDLKIAPDPEDSDGLNFLSNKSLAEINREAFEGTLLAHQAGGVPNLILQIPEISPYFFGQLVYFFEKACAISGYLAGINPFDQPGVEAYKRNMFALLGKPGFERERQQLQQKLKGRNQ